MRSDEGHISKLFADSTGDSGLDFLKLLKKESLKKDSIVETGPFVAYVLQVEEVEVGTSHTWIDEIKINFGVEEKNKLKPAPNPLDNQRWIKVYARITSDYLTGQPNLHAYLPMPKQIGSDQDLEGDVNSQRLIKMHHGFMGNLSETTRPSPGDFIWVDFLDKRNLRKPVYIKKLTKTPSGAPCLDGTCPPNPFTKAPAKGQSLNKTKGKDNNLNPNAPQNITPVTTMEEASHPGPSTCRPNGKPYILKGYRADDFTTFDEYIKGKYKDNMEITLCAMEVIAYHFENLYPNDKITLKIPKNPGIAYPPQEQVAAGKNRHHIGKAVDVAVYRNNTPVDKPLVWAALMKLIINGHLPDGGVGYFQTNAPKGPNKGIKTTFSTNLPGSDWPHYDWDDSNGRPAKWIEATLENKPVIFSSDALGKWGKAEEWASATAAGHTHMPASCMQALADPITDPCFSLPELQDVFAARKKAREEETHNTTRTTSVFRGAGSGLSLGTLKLSPSIAPRQKIQYKGKLLSPLTPTEQAKVEADVGLAPTPAPETKTRYQPFDPSRKKRACVIDKKGAFRRTSDQQDPKRLDPKDLNFPPGFILDPDIIPQDTQGAKGKKKAKLGLRLKHVSFFVIHETAVEMNPTSQAYRRYHNITKGGTRKKKYVSGEEAYVARFAKDWIQIQRKKYWKKYQKAKKKRDEIAAKLKKEFGSLANPSIPDKKHKTYSTAHHEAARLKLKWEKYSPGASKTVKAARLQEAMAHVKKSADYKKRMSENNFGKVEVGKVSWSPSQTWHFATGRAGEIICMMPWNRYVAMSNWANSWASGAENCVGWGGYVATNPKRYKQYMKAGGKTIGINNSFWGTVLPRDRKKLFEDLGIAGFGWFGPNYGRTMPGMTQMERQYQLIKWLDSKHNPFAADFIGFDSSWYPSTINSPRSEWKTWQTTEQANKILSRIRERGRKRQKTIVESNIRNRAHRGMIANNRPLFPWGRFNPAKINRSRSESSWKGRGALGRRNKLKHHWQKGVVCHARWGSHTDGVMIEYYCLGRDLGLPPLAAFYACVGAYCSSGGVNQPDKAFKNPNLKKIKTGKQRPYYTYFPNDPAADYPGLGRAIWEGNPALRHSAVTSYGTSVDDAPVGKNPVDWPVRIGSLYDPNAKIPVVKGKGAKAEIVHTQIGTGRGYVSPQDIKNMELIIASLPDNPPELGEKKSGALGGADTQAALLKQALLDMKSSKGPFYSNSHFIADRGSRATVIPTAGWSISKDKSRRAAKKRLQYPVPGRSGKSPA